MSGFNPVAAPAAGAALSQSAITAIDLGVEIEILQSQLAVGDLLTATVLPPQGGSDRLSLVGQTVLAQLPPGIDPGESLLLQITGFQGNQVLVQNLGTVDPNDLPPTVSLVLPQTAPGAVAQATLATLLPRNTPAAATPPAAAAPTLPETTPGTAPAPAQAPPQVAPAGPIPGAVAPPRAIFVAASVQPAPAVRAPAAAAAPAGFSAEPESAASAAAQQIEQLGLEARIVVTRAASIDLSELVTAAPAQPPTRATPPSQTPPTQAVPPPAPPPPRITPATAQETPAARAPEAALLARLRVPLLPVTLAAAKLAGNAAALLPRALARLDAALARTTVQPSASDADSQAASLRATIGFVQRLDPGNTRALPEQIAAFVNNFVDGAESKLAAIVRALLPELADAAAADPLASDALATNAPVADTPPESLLLPPPAPGAPLVPQAATPAADDAPPPAAMAPSAAARVAERTVALQYDAKAAILALSQSPPRGASPELGQALSDALTTVTALQLNVLGAQQNDPSAISIPMPVFYHENGRPVLLHISRDKPGGGKLDADNFHIAFVLDTKSLGTVAVDVQTAGRAASVSVKTEGATAADRFRSTLGDLRGRLEQLRYRVASISAHVAPPNRVTPSTAEREVRRDADARAPHSILDTSA